MKGSPPASSKELFFATLFGDGVFGCFICCLSIAWVSNPDAEDFTSLTAD